MSEEPITPKTPASRRWAWIRRFAMWIILILVSAFLTGCPLLIETPVHFLIGWWLHAEKVLPPLLGKWPAVLLPAGCLLLAAVLIHRFVSRCLAAKEKPLQWRPAQTIACLALLLLGCSAAIALSGVLHQTVWMMAGRPLYDNHYRRSDRMRSITNARHLMLALEEFRIANGRYPIALKELSETNGYSKDLAWVSPGNGSVIEPFVLLKPGGTGDSTEIEPIIVSPVLISGDRIVVGYFDTTVSTLPASKLESILAGGGKLRTQTPPDR